MWCRITRPRTMRTNPVSGTQFRAIGRMRVLDTTPIGHDGHGGPAGSSGMWKTFRDSRKMMRSCVIFRMRRYMLDKGTVMAEDITIGLLRSREYAN